MQGVLVAMYNDGEGAHFHNTVLLPWPSQPGESVAPNTAIHQGRDCMLTLFWQARECAEALTQAEAQCYATSKTACILWWLTCRGRARRQTQSGRRSTPDCAYAAPRASAARTCRTQYTRKTLAQAGLLVDCLEQGGVQSVRVQDRAASRHN